MRLEQFEALVEEAVSSLPPALLERLDNVALVVEERPSPEKLRELEMEPDEVLYGLYEGISQPERVHSAYDAVLPDKITIYREPLERDFPHPEDLKREIAVTVKHEIAHHFGLDHQQLEDMGLS